MDKLISVILPVYNMEKYINRCLDSITSQTYQNLEIIIVDDGSTDSSLSICQKWQQKDRRIKVITKKNGGVSSARNAGLIVSRGDYIAFVDPDDWIAPQMYEILLNNIIEYSADGSFCNFYFVKENIEMKASVRIEETICANKDQAFFYSIAWGFQGGGYFTSVWNKLFLREKIFSKEGSCILFDTNLLIGEDETWLMEVLSHCNKIVLDHHPLYYYLWLRKDGASAVNTFSKHRIDEAETKIKSVEKVRKLNLSEATINVAKANLVDVISSLLAKYNNKLSRTQIIRYTKAINMCYSGWAQFYKVSFWGRLRKKALILLINMNAPTTMTLAVYNMTGAQHSRR